MVASALSPGQWATISGHLNSSFHAAPSRSSAHWCPLCKYWHLCTGQAKLLFFFIIIFFFFFFSFSLNERPLKNAPSERQAGRALRPICGPNIGRLSAGQLHSTRTLTTGRRVCERATPLYHWPSLTVSGWLLSAARSSRPASWWPGRALRSRRRP